MIEVTVPDGTCGDWRVESFVLTQKMSDATRLRDYVPPGSYKRLMHKNVVVMSNTPMEYRTNYEFIHRAHGNVLINGLGLGMVLKAILEKPSVLSVKVIEVSPEVIELVGPSFHDDPRVSIICADAFDYQPDKEERFDVVWHDIWNFICGDNVIEMQKLHRKYGRRTSWQASWCRSSCESHLKAWNREKRSMRR